MDLAADAMSESEDDAEAEQEATQRPQLKSTGIEHNDVQTADNRVSSARLFYE